jgi:hypothetical protein
VRGGAAITYVKGALVSGGGGESAVEGGDSATRWRGPSRRRGGGGRRRGGRHCRRGSRARRRGGPARAIEHGATTGEDEEGARGRFPSRAERAESPGVDVNEEVGAGEGGGGVGATSAGQRRRSERGEKWRRQHDDAMVCGEGSGRPRMQWRRRQLR